jgi:hypothetical protein
MLSVKHYFVSPKADGPDPTLVQPSAWNHEHVLTSASGILLGRASSGTGNVEEIGLGGNFVFVGGALKIIDNPKFTGTYGIVVPSGTTAQRDPAPVGGEIRYNTDTGQMEFYTSAGWSNGYDFAQGASAAVYFANPLNLQTMSAGFGILYNSGTVDTINLNDGQVRTLYVHDGCTFTSSAGNIIIPGNPTGTITCRSGDVVTFRGYPGTRVLLQNIMRVDGQALSEAASFEVSLDGGGAALVNGTYVDIVVPYNFSATQWTVLADRSAYIYLNLYYCTYSQYDGGASHPASGDAIVGSNYPCVQAATKGQNNLSGWSRSYFGAGDIIRVLVNSTDGNIQKLTFSLQGWHV